MIAIDAGCGCPSHTLASMIQSGAPIFGTILAGAWVGGWIRRVAISIPIAASASFLFWIIRITYVGRLADEPLGRFAVGVTWLAVMGAAWLIPPDGISPMPGALLDRITKSLCLKRSYEHVFQPVIANMQEEYLDALAHDGRVHAQWTLLLWYVVFVRTVILHIPIRLLRLIATLWKLT